MRLFRGPFPVIVAGLAIVAAVHLFADGIGEAVRPIGEVLAVPPALITAILGVPGEALVILGLLRVLPGARATAGGNLLGCGAVIVLIIGGAVAVVRVVLIIQAALEEGRLVLISLLLLVLVVAAVGAGSWYLVKVVPRSKTQADAWLRDATLTLAVEAVGKNEHEIRELCDAHVELLYANSARFRRSVHHEARQRGTVPWGVLGVYRRMLYENLQRQRRWRRRSD